MYPRFHTKQGLGRPAQFISHHYTSSDQNFFIKRQYGFLIVACILAAFTIIYSTAVLLTRLPDTSSHRILSKNKLNSNTPSTPFTSFSPLSSNSCNASSSPFDLHLRGEPNFPLLAAFLHDRTMLLEDMHPASFWVVGREFTSVNHLHAFIDWGIKVPVAIVTPLPAGMMPLFTQAPHSVECSWSQVRHHWEAPQQRLREKEQQGHGGQEIHEVRLRTDLSENSTGMTLPGMGHPQGLFFRVSLPAVLQPQEDPDAGAAGRGRKDKEMKSSIRGGGDTARKPLARQEHE